MRVSDHLPKAKYLYILYRYNMLLFGTMLESSHKNEKELSNIQGIVPKKRLPMPNKRQKKSKIYFMKYNVKIINYFAL